MGAAKALGSCIDGYGSGGLLQAGSRIDALAEPSFTIAIVLDFRRASAFDRLSRVAFSHCMSA